MTVYLFDNHMNLKTPVKEKDVVEYVDELNLNGLIHSDLILNYNGEVDKSYFYGSTDVDDSNTFNIYKINDLLKTSNSLSLVGVHIVFDELKVEVVRDLRPRNLSIREAFERVFSDSKWKLGVCESENVASASFYYQSRLSALYEMLEIWNVEFKPRIVFDGKKIVGRYIDIYDSISKDHGKWYDSNSNLLTVREDENRSELYTALIGRGRGEEIGDGFGRAIDFKDIEWTIENGDPVDKPISQDYVEIPSATAELGFRLGVVEFSEIEDREQLLQATYTDLLSKCRPRREFTSTVFEDGLIELGETVTINEPKLGIKYKTRVSKLRRDNKRPNVKTATFGDKVVTTSAERTKAESKAVRMEISTKTQSMYSQMQEQVTRALLSDTAQNYILDVGNEYDLPAGIYSFNAPIEANPSKVIYVGAGTLAIANSKLSGGRWNWTTFADGDGIGAEMIGAKQIIANSITTEHIATNVLTASNIQLFGGETLENYINMASETHRDILPPSNAKKDDVWIKPKMQVKDLRDINMLELQKFGVTVSELLGGGVYVATGDVSSSSFNHWVKVASDETFARGGITNIENGLVEVVKYGDLATAGRTLIDGNNIKTGRIQDELGANYIDLDLGEIDFGQGDFTYSPNEGMQIAGFNVTKDGFETNTYEPFLNDYTLADRDKVEAYIRGTQEIPSGSSEFQRLDINGDGLLDIVDIAHIDRLIIAEERDLLRGKRILLNPMDTTISVSSGIFRKNGETARSFGETKITKDLLEASAIKFTDLIVGDRKGINANITIDGKEYQFTRGILTNIKDI